MSELTPFSNIPSKWDWHYENGEDVEYPYTPEQEEAAEFLSKMDWEGGVDGLIQYGGAEYFPAELQELASEYELAHTRLRAAIDVWAAERGVEY